MKRFPAFFLLLAFCTACYAQEPGHPGDGGGKPEKPPKKEPELEEKSSVTEHKGVFGGEEIAYTATAGTIVLKKDEREPEASVFYVAYTKNSEESAGDRPIVFCFNGGPGSSSVWLHLGGFGPKRAQMNADGTLPHPPFRLGPNPDSILRVADLVFVDPVSTGYSRAPKEEDAKGFHGFQGDLESIAEFIRLYTTRNGRWLSPKFLAGESYGAFRAAGLSEVLHRKYGYYLNGIVLVSGVLSFDTLWGENLSSVCILPSLAEVAAYHGKLEGDIAEDADARRKEVEAFAKGEYATALLLGARLPAEQKTEIARKVAAYTGLDAGLVERLDLKIDEARFREELLRDKGVMLGRFDGRVIGQDGDLAALDPDFDPSYTAVYGPFSATLNDYLRQELKFESDLIYEILTPKVRPWDYGKMFVGEPIAVTGMLASAMSQNPYLKVMVNCGYQDLATPYSSIQHSLEHLAIAPALRDNISFTFYEGGHMMYSIETSNSAWNRDVADFIQANSGVR